MSGKILKPRVMSMEELEAEIKADEKALMETTAEPVVTPEPTPTQEPTKAESEKGTPPKEESPKEEAPVEPAPVVPDSSEMDTLKAQLAEKEARLTELTKRIRDEDGKRGGELSTLRNQMENLGNQLRDLISENKELRQNPPKPAEPQEPDPLETEYPEVAKGMDRRTRPVLEAAQRAEREAKEAKEELRKMQENQRRREYDSFLSSIKTAVPKLDEHNGNPEFLQWCLGKNPASPYTRQQVLDACSASMDSVPVVELFQQWEREKNPVTPKSTETPKGPAKPTKEAQLEVPKSSAPASTKPKIDLAKEIKRIEDKVFKGIGGIATQADRLEYERLLDMQEKELVKT